MRWLRLIVASPVALALLVPWSIVVAIDIACTMAMRGIGAFITWEFA